MSNRTSSGDLRTEWLRWLPIGGVVGLAVFVCLIILFIRVRHPYVAAALIGLLFVQILLAAVWTTLAPCGLFSRFIAGTVFVLFLCLCMFRCAYRDGGGAMIAVPIAGAMLLQWMVYQIPLWYLRLKGWKLNSSNAQSAHRREEVQFGIKHLLIWTTVVAIFLGIARLITPHLQMENSGTPASLQLGLHLTLGNSLIALPIVWGSLSRHYFWRWILVAIVVCAFVCWGQTIVAGGAQMQFDFLWAINIAQTIISILAMLALRFTGLRLHRTAP